MKHTDGVLHHEDVALVAALPTHVYALLPPRIHERAKHGGDHPGPRKRPAVGAHVEGILRRERELVGLTRPVVQYRTGERGEAGDSLRSRFPARAQRPAVSAAHHPSKPVVEICTGSQSRLSARRTYDETRRQADDKMSSVRIGWSVAASARRRARAGPDSACPIPLQHDSLATECEFTAPRASRVFGLASAFFRPCAP